jgi:type IV secretion system protein VirB10
MTLSPDAQPGVPGERGAAVVARGLSLQSRIGNLLALGLMLAIGMAFLAWYYGHVASRPASARQGALQQLAGRAQAEMALPSLGPMPRPPLAMPTENAAPPAAPDPVAPTPESALTLMPAPPPVGGVRMSALDRRLSGTAFASARSMATVTSGSQPGGDDAGLPTLASPAPTQGQIGAAAGAQSGAQRGSATTLEGLLRAPVAPAVQAHLLPTQRWLLPKGAFIDCTLETAIDSTLPGLTTCVTATDTFGADGRVVLLDRGTKLIGETQGQVQQGAARVFVLWTEARTPTGVVVPLDSPATDELGRSGLAGEVNRHFWQRFGAAILISTIDGAVQASVRSAGSGGTVIYNPTGSEQVMSDVLRDTVNIAPTVTKQNGDRIQVLVARDVDFSSVYELRRAGSNP